MKKITLYLIIILSVQLNYIYANDSQKLTLLVELYQKEKKEISTIEIEKAKPFFRNYDKLISEIDSTKLSKEEILTLEILKWEINMDKKNIEFQIDLMPFNHHRNILKNIKIRAQNPNFYTNEKHFENYLKILSNYCNWIDISIQKMKIGIQKEIVLPKIIVNEMISQFDCENFNDEEINLLYNPLKFLNENFSEEFNNEMSEKIKKYLSTEVYEKQMQMFIFLKEELLPNAYDEIGISNLPDGDLIYNYLIEKYTTTTLTANEIHEIGLKEVKRIEEEMKLLQRKMGFKGSLNDFFNYVNDISFRKYENPNEILNQLDSINKIINTNINIIFNEIPKSKLEIKRTDAFREQFANPEYIDGNYKNSIPGTFYLPIKDKENYNNNIHESVFLHEAIPGHHHQLSLVQEKDDFSNFRKNIWYESYGEGWALYAESLGFDLGLYKNDLQYFGKLDNEMHRALRLVIDTGIHSKNWSFKEAVEFSMKYESKSKNEIEYEIKRYIAIPGLALSYKIGELKILELKNYSIEKLKNNFNIKDFHSEILNSGHLPLFLLEEKIQNWVQNNLPQ